MAHRTKAGISVEYRPRVLLERANLAALLGVVSAEWSNLDSHIMFLYALLMGRYLPSPPGFTPPLHPVALQVFDTLETQRLRLDLLEKLGKWLIKDEELLEELKSKVLPSIKRASKLRNALVHADWGIANEYPEDLILKPTFGHHMVYTEDDFNEAINRILNARDAIVAFEQKLRKAWENNA